MLYEIMKHIRNFFVRGEKIQGEFHIEDGSISLPLLDGQYFLIEGSILNDGVYRYPIDVEVQMLPDETFFGTITPLAPPQDFISLCNEIEEYNNKVPASVYTSESFGGYSYQKATDKDGNVAGWQSAYKKRLDVYRKI